MKYVFWFGLIGLIIILMRSDSLNVDKDIASGIWVTAWVILLIIVGSTSKDALEEELGIEETHTPSYDEFSYEELLNTVEWKNCRNWVLSKHRWTCDWCGKHDNLQVHHRYYLKCPTHKKVYPWQYPEDCFMCLCDDCHKKLHNKYKINTYFTKC